MDLGVAIVTFLFILLASIYLYNYVFEGILIREERSDLLRVSHYLTSSLLQTPGNPANWTEISDGRFNTGNISSLGLAVPSNLQYGDLQERGSTAALKQAGLYVLHESKVSRLADLDSTKNETLAKLLGAAGYHFHISFDKWNGSDYNTAYGVGTEPVGATHVVRIDRMAIINDTRTHVVIKVWQECLVRPC